MWKTLFVTCALLLCSTPVAAETDDEKQEPVITPSGYEIIKETHIPQDLIHSISIELERESLVIEPSNDSIITVVSYGREGVPIAEEEKVNFLLTDDQLVIRAGKAGETASGEHDQQVTLFLPQEYHSALRLKLGAGTLEAGTPLISENFSLELESGEAEIAELSAQRYQIQNNSGSVSIGSLSGSGKVAVVSGEITINGASPDDFLQLESDSGSIDCALDSDLAFQFQGTQGEGSIETAFPLDEQESSLGDGQLSATVGEGPFRQLKADTHTGSIRLTLN